MYFDSIRENPQRCAKVVPFDQFDADLSSGSLPRFVFVTPDLDHDMHGLANNQPDSKTVPAADAWLKDTVGRITASAAYRKDGLVVIAADGPDPAVPGDGRIGALLLSKFVEKGGSLDTEYDQLSLLKTLGGIFGLRELGAAQDEDVKPFDESLFASSSQDVHDSATRR
jgi:hypothetical protein